MKSISVSPLEADGKNRTMLHLETNAYSSYIDTADFRFQGLPLFPVFLDRFFYEQQSLLKHTALSPSDKDLSNPDLWDERPHDYYFTQAYFSTGYALRCFAFHKDAEIKKEDIREMRGYHELRAEAQDKLAAAYQYFYRVFVSGYPKNGLKERTMSAFRKIGLRAPKFLFRVMPTDLVSPNTSLGEFPSAHFYNALRLNGRYYSGEAEMGALQAKLVGKPRTTHAEKARLRSVIKPPKPFIGCVRPVVVSCLIEERNSAASLLKL